LAEVVEFITIKPAARYPRGWPIALVIAACGLSFASLLGSARRLSQAAQGKSLRGLCIGLLRLLLGAETSVRKLSSNVPSCNNGPNGVTARLAH